MEVKSLEDKIADFVAELLEKYEPPRVRDRKAIHEPVYGTNVYECHEIALLDSPLLQRLRRVSQTGLAFLVFPGATHNRFTHTLGTITAATKIARSIAVNSDPLSISINMDPLKGDLAHIRMAALLHDCGHAFFSHASEEIYASTDNCIRDLLTQDKFAQVKAHELLAYFIVTSVPFREFFENHILRSLYHYTVSIDLDVVADMIIGNRMEDDRDFLWKIVNGACDGDKLDYIPRDGHCTGLPLTLDLDRLFYTMCAHRAKADGGKPSLIFSKPTPMEELLFSKMLLYTTVYHHHKVKACDSLLWAIVESAREHKVEIAGSPLEDPVDFLRLTDYEILGSSGDTGSDDVNRLLLRLRNRQLPKRALNICVDTVENYEECAFDLIRLSKQSEPSNYSDVKKLRRDIFNAQEGKGRCRLDEIHISLPTLPSLREASQICILTAPDHPVSLNKRFPLDGWLNTYAVDQWRGYVFCPPYAQKTVHEAAKQVLAKKYDFRFHPINSRAFVHLEQI